VLRRVLLAVSASQRVRRLITSAPVTRSVVRRFVAGETARDAIGVAEGLLADGLTVTLDYLGEDTAVPEHAVAVAQEYVSLIEMLQAGGLTAGGRTEVSVKPTAVGLGLPENGEKTAAENIMRICAAAKTAGTTVTVDMEDHTRVEATLRVVDQVRADFPDLGCVVQSYLRRTPGDCEALAVTGSRVRLCKGAYSAPDGVAFAARSEVDRNYARCLRILLDGDGYPMLATHDPRLIAIAHSRAATLGRAPASFEYQLLYGIRPDEQRR
jgi:proline dehydrogenase